MELFILDCGHTQNENHSVHSVIEQNIKGVLIYHPCQCITLVKGTCRSRPYILYPMFQEDFLNFQTDVNGM